MKEYRVDKHAVLRTVLITLFFLFLANVAVIYSTHYLGHGRLFGLVRLFDFNSEFNPPTLFSAVLILINAFLFYILYRDNLLGGSSKYFLVLSWIFVFLAFDEMLKIHEMTIEPLRALLHGDGLFYYMWVIPYGALVLLLALYLIPFFRDLPKRYLWLYLLSGVVFITGAMVLDSLEARHFRMHGIDVIYHVYTTIEELLEMGGMILAMYTSMTILEETSGGFHMTLFEKQKKRGSENVCGRSHLSSIMGPE